MDLNMDLKTPTALFVMVNTIFVFVFNVKCHVVGIVLPQAVIFATKKSFFHHKVGRFCTKGSHPFLQAVATVFSACHCCATTFGACIQTERQAECNNCPFNAGEIAVDNVCFPLGQLQHKEDDQDSPPLKPAFQKRTQTNGKGWGVLLRMPHDDHHIPISVILK